MTTSESSDRPRQRLRRFRWFVGLPLLLGVAFVLISFGQVWRATTASFDGEASAVVILGAAQYDGDPSPVFERRLRHGFALYEAGQADVIVTTGSNQEGDRFTEGFAGYEFLRDLGVPDEDLLVVVDGKNTWEQLSATRAVLNDRGINDVVIVSDAYHALRSRLIAEDVGLTAEFSSAGGTSSFRELTRETAGVVLGRLFGFRRLSNLS